MRPATAVIAVAVLTSCGSATATATPSATPTASAAAASPCLNSTSNPPATLTVGRDEWTEFMGDSARTGNGPPTPAARDAHCAWTAHVDGDVYGQPLVAGTVVIAGTSHNFVYALDAATGAVRWRTSLGRPVPLVNLQCGDIDPNGVTSTPVIDLASGIVYAVAMLLAPIRHEMFGLRLTDGSIVSHQPADPPGADPTHHQQRGSLNLANGYVYMSYGGFFGDCGNYHGWVVGAPTAGGVLRAWRVPSDNAGAVWAPPGPVISTSGDVWVTSGNTQAGVLDGNDGGNSVFRLNGALSAAKDSWYPKNWASLNNGDADLGSLAPALLANGLVFVAGKDGVGYLLRADHLGGRGGDAFSDTVCVNPAGSSVYFGGYGGAAVAGAALYVPCSNALVALHVDPGKPSFTVKWRTSGRANSPVLAYGLVWTVASSVNEARIWTGTLKGHDAATGKVVTQLPLGPTPHFPAPAVANGSLYIGGLGVVYGVSTS